MNWLEVKVATLQKMFAAEGNEIPDDGSADDYLAAMPQAANEALNMLATAGRFFIKSYVINHDATGDTQKYDMNALVNDFYEVDRIYFENGTSYGEFSRYRMENGKIVLYGCPSGTYTVYYRAYPEWITKDTADEYTIELPPEVAVLLPLYMASQLYKDDDAAIATSYRNEWEVAFERLRNIDNSDAEFTSESGWI